MSNVRKGACSVVDKYGTDLQVRRSSTVVWRESAYLEHAFDVMVARRKAAPLHYS